MKISMHPVVKTLLVCVLIGLGFGSYFYFSADQRWERIVNSVLSSLCIGCCMMAVVYNSRRLTGWISYQTGKIILVIGCLIIAALLGSELTFFLFSLIVQGESYHAFSGGHLYLLNILIVLVTGIPMYIAEEWKTLLNNRILNQQYRVLQLEQQQTAFELELLRAKINPHFLYNMHNTIAALISEDPARAEELVLLLSKFFRFTLNKNSTTYHSIQEEIDIISTYLQMQQIRYESRMRYSIEVDPQVLSKPMPSFILQPIVENALKHGIEVMEAGGEVEVNIQPEGKDIVLTVSDNGPDFPDQPGSGHGLQLVMNKLALLYADRYTIELNNAPTKYVRITIPG